MQSIACPQCVLPQYCCSVSCSRALLRCLLIDDVREGLYSSVQQTIVAAVWWCSAVFAHLALAYILCSATGEARCAADAVWWCTQGNTRGY
jgi:hypothetical protein